MNDKEREYQVKNHNYIVLASILISVFILMIAMTNLNYYILQNKEETDIDAKNLHRPEEKKQIQFNASCIIVTGQYEKESNRIVQESLKKAKMPYSVKASFGDITNQELQSAKIIIINGSNLNTIGDVDKIYEYIDKGKHIIFTSMPVAGLELKNMKEIMGIKNVTQAQYQEGVNFLPGFLLGGLLELPNISFDAPKVELLSTTKTYVTGSEGQPIIWRNVNKASEVYVVNGSFFETNAGYGILSAIMAQINEDYIYPIINSKVFTYKGLPFISYDNALELKEIYNRTAMQIQQDILIPDILSINKSRGLIPNGFIVSFVDDKNRIELYSRKQIINYEKDIYKLGGEVGMVYSGDLEKDLDTYANLFKNKDVKSILIKDKQLDRLKEFAHKVELNSLEAVLGPWEPTKESFSYLTESAVFIPFTIDGLANTDSEKLSLYSSITAFGAIVHNLDLEQIITTNPDRVNWMDLSRDYIKLVDSYREKFNMIQARNISETAQSIKKYVNNTPTIEYYTNQITIKFDKWYGESYYILRTGKEISNISGGNYIKIEENVYLVIVKNKEVTLDLRPMDQYDRW